MSPPTSSSPASPPPSHAPAPLVALVTEVVERAGLVLDHLDVRPAGRRSVVRVTVDDDRVPGPDDDAVGGIDLDAVAAVSRELSAAFDRADGEPGADPAAPPGEYTLEVTTPGVDRPLTRPHHWRRAWLRRAVIGLADGTEVTARVGPVTDEGAVTVAVPTRRGTPELRAIAFGDVARAVLDVEFKAPSEVEVTALRTVARGRAGQDEQDDEQGKDHT